MMKTSMSTWPRFLHSRLDGGIPEDDRLSSYDCDIALMAEKSDPRDRYRLYKSNADQAIVASSVFGRAWLDRRSKSHESEGDRDRVASRGKCYYSFAASIEQKLKFGSSAVSEVLSKLSERFDLYGRILSHVRSTHLSLFGRMTTGEMYHLTREAHKGAKPALIQKGRDRFIDAYSEWMRTPSRESGRKVNRLAEFLGNLDSEFRFEEV
jgi:hypothetical protein